MASRKIGLEPEEIRQLLMEKHDVALGKEDPILMLVTLHNAFTAEYNRLLKRHHEALMKTMKKVLGATSGEVRAISDDLMSQTVRTTIESTVTEISLHKSAMETFLAELRKQHAINLVCSVVCLAALVGVILFGGLA